MSKAVSNVSPLIYLSKIGALHLLFEIFEEILIPEEVLREILRGEERYPAEVRAIKNLISSGKIKVRSPEAKYVDKLIALSKKLHKGEVAAIALALSESIKVILVDDKAAYSSAKVLGLKPLRTTALLLLLVAKGKLSAKDFKSILLDLVSAGFYLTADVYEMLIKKAEEIESASKSRI